MALLGTTSDRVAREDLAVEIPDPVTLLERVRALPGADVLLAKLPAAPTVHLVGGAVRDLLLRREPLELDLVVEGEVGPVAAALGGDLVEHDRFGTSSVRAGGRRYDLARSRRERYSQPGALPEVEPAPLAEDLRRRDFTVNALAVALTAGVAGTLTAAPGAAADLEAGRLRVLHPASFRDDPTRMLRLVRLAARLGFEVEAGTAELLQDAVRAGALSTVSGSRIGAELRRIAREPDAVEAMALLTDLGLAGAIHADFGLRDVAQAQVALALLDEAGGGRADLLVLAAAARSVPADELRMILDVLGFEAGDRDAVLSAATGADALAQALSGARLASGIAEAARGRPAEAVALAGAARAGDAAPAARRWLTELSSVELSIGGQDLLDAGVAPGPAVGAGLRAALAAKLDGAVSGREQELRFALRVARGGR